MYMRKQEKTEFVIDGNYLLQVPTIMIHENKKKINLQQYTIIIEVNNKWIIAFDTVNVYISGH